MKESKKKYNNEENKKKIQVFKLKKMRKNYKTP